MSFGAESSPQVSRVSSVVPRMAAPSPPTGVYREASQAALAGLVVNLLLGLVKLVAGSVGHSFALLADSVNSLGDALSSMVVLFAFRVAQKPADPEHPYGHSRAEGVAATNVAVLMAVSAVLIAYEAVERLGVSHFAPPAWVLWVAFGNVIVKEGLYRYKRSVARKAGSAALLANAWDHRSDALCSLAVLCGMGIVWWGGPRYAMADELAALVVAGGILLGSLHLFRTSASELLDAQADADTLAHIRALAASVPGVAGIEKLWVRKTGLELHADIHVEVDPGLTVREGHDIGHRVQDKLLADIPRLCHVLVHLEPHREIEHPDIA